MLRSIDTTLVTDDGWAYGDCCAVALATEGPILCRAVPTTLARHNGSRSMWVASCAISNTGVCMAANSNKPSEFGGKSQKNTIQPPITPRGGRGHTPTPSEEMHLLYATGQTVDSTRPPDTGEAMTGILPLREAKAAMPQPTLQRDLDG